MSANSSMVVMPLTFDGLVEADFGTPIILLHYQSSASVWQCFD